MGPMTLSIRINADGSAAITGLRQVDGAINRTGQNARQTTGQINAAGDGFKRLAGLAAMAATALAGVGLVRDFLGSIQATTSLAKGLEAITGSASAAAAELAYVRTAASELGLSANTAGASFLSLSASAKGSALEGQATRAAFESITRTMGLLGKSTADTEGALYGLGQMLATESVMLEDFNIISERIPGTQKRVADGLGITVAAMRGMITDGNLLTKDVIPIMTAQMDLLAATGAPIKTLGAEWNRMRTAVEDAYKTVNDSVGITEALAGAVVAVTGTIVAFNAALASGDLDGWLMALNGAIGAATGVAALAVAINAAAAAQAIFNALVAVNPYVAAAVAIAALAGAIYALRDETITLGDETTTVGATIRAAWEITTELTQSLWQSFTGWFAEATAGMGIDFQGATSFIETAWTGGMDWLIDKATATVNGLISLFKAAGTTIGAIIAEIAISWETRTAPSFDRLVGYLQENIKYEDHLANAGIVLTKTTQGLNEELQKKAGQITWLAQQEADYAELERDLAADQSRAAAQEKAMLALTKAQTEAKLGLTKATEGKAKARTGASAATKAATAAEREHKQALDDTNRSVQALIDRYLPARKAAEDYAEAEKAVAAALAGGPGSVALSAEEAATIMAGLAKDQAEAANKAQTESSAFAKAWERAVERIDDMFANMWKDLITGTGNTFDNIKDMLLSWLAEMAHALLTRPLVVSITTAMTPGAASAAGGTTGGMGGLGGIGSWLGGNSLGSGIASGLSNLGLGGSNASALGPMQPPGWLSGIANTPNWVLGGSAMLGGLAGSLLFGGKGYSGIGSTVGSTAGSIGGSALAGGLALTGPAGWALAALGGLLGGIAGGGIGSLFGNDEPRYGRLMASTGGRYKDLEDGKDGAYAKGSFGLNFGLSDQGSKNIDAMEYMEVYEGLAKVSDALAAFYGPELAKKVEDELAKWPHIWGTKFEKGTAGALKAIVDAISDVAEGTGDDIGVIFNRVLGELTGSAEEMAAQIEAAMQTTALLFEAAKTMKGSDLGGVLGLNADTGDAALQLLTYAQSIATAGEATGASVQRLLVNLTGLEQAALLTGDQLAVVGQAYVNLSSQLAAAAEAAGGSMQALIGQQTAYYQHFFSEEERATITRDQSLAAIAQWNEAQGLSGEALINSSESLRAYVESLDLTTDAGREAYVAAMAISGIFITLDQALTALGDTVGGITPQIEDLTERIAALTQDLKVQIEDARDPGGAVERRRRRELAEATRGMGRDEAAELIKLYEELWRLEDASAAAAAASERLREATERLAAAQALADAAAIKIADLEDPAGALGRARERELAEAIEGQTPETAAELHRLYETLWELEDAATAASAAAEALARAQEQKADLEMRYLELTGSDAEILAAKRALERASIDKSNWALLDLIYAREDEIAALARQKEALTDAINREYDAKIAAIDAQEAASQASHEASMKRLDSQRNAAQEALSAAEGVLSMVQSALDGLRGQQGFQEMAYARAARQLATWARSGDMPEAESLERVLGVIGTASPDEFATAAAWEASQKRTLANLLALENKAEKEVNWAERQVQAIESQIEAMNGFNERTQANFAAQREQAAAWRDAQLAGMDAQLQALIGLPSKLGDLIKPLPVSVDLPQNVIRETSQAQTTEIKSLKEELVLLRKDMAAAQTATVIPLKSLDDRTKKWDLDGMPAPRDDGDGSTVVIMRAA